MRLHIADDPIEPNRNRYADHANWLAEVCSVGAGRAASRLSDLIDRRCLINPPQVLTSDSGHLFTAFNREDALAVSGSVRVVGEIPARVIVLLRRADAHLLLQYSTRLPRARGGRFDFTSQFAIRRLIDTLTVSFCGNVYKFLRATPWYGMAELVSGPWSTVLRTKLQALEGQHHQMVIHTSFYDADKSFSGLFLFVLDPETQRKMIERIRLLLDS